MFFVRESGFVKLLYGISRFEISTGYGIDAFLITTIGSQRKIATGIRILKRKPEILMIILPEVINLKYLCRSNFLKTFLHLVHTIS